MNNTTTSFVFQLLSLILLLIYLLSIPRFDWFKGSDLDVPTKAEYSFLWPLILLSINESD